MSHLQNGNGARKVAEPGGVSKHFSRKPRLVSAAVGVSEPGWRGDRPTQYRNQRILPPPLNPRLFSIAIGYVGLSEGIWRHLIVALAVRSKKQFAAAPFDNPKPRNPMREFMLKLNGGDGRGLQKSASTRLIRAIRIIRGQKIPFVRLSVHSLRSLSVASRSYK